MPQLGNHDQIFPPGQYFIYSGKLSGQTDRMPYILGFGRDVKSVYGSGASVLFEQRGEDSDNRRLARAVGAKQGENLTALHFKIDAL
ncbi:hypothetical protein D3C71_1617800 [compost metagenome]